MAVILLPYLKAERLLLADLAGVFFLALDLGDLGEANVIVKSGS